MRGPTADSPAIGSPENDQRIRQWIAKNRKKKNRRTGIGIVGENRRRTARIRNLLERCQTDIDDCASSAQKDEIARYTEDSQ